MEQVHGQTKQIKASKLSFDSECNMIKNSKAVRRKMRDVFNLGEKIENFVYPVEPYLSQLNDQFLKDDGVEEDEARERRQGLPASCDSLSQQDVLNCNARVLKRAFGKASEGLWNSMSKIGISNLHKEGDPVERIKEMEARDAKGEEANKGNFYQPP